MQITQEDNNTSRQPLDERETRHYHSSISVGWFLILFGGSETFLANISLRWGLACCKKNGDVTGESVNFRQPEIWCHRSWESSWPVELPTGSATSCCAASRWRAPCACLEEKDPWLSIQSDFATKNELKLANFSWYKRCNHRL